MNMESSRNQEINFVKIAYSTELLDRKYSLLNVYFSMA